MAYDPNYWGTICELDDEPEPQVCPSCNGKGVDEWDETCLQCGGNGYVDSDGFAIFEKRSLASICAPRDWAALFTPSGVLITAILIVAILT